MARNVIFTLFLVLSFSLYSSSNNQMDDFFLLQKQKSSLNKDINSIYLIHSLGYPEKSIQKLYILLDQFSKTEFDNNIKEIYNTLKTKDFDKKILNSIAFIISKEEKTSLELDKEIISIYKTKGDNTSTGSVHRTVSPVRKGESVTRPQKINKTITHPNSEKIELAIVASEWIDDFNIENSIKYSLMLKTDPYYNNLAIYFKYLQDKKKKPLEELNSKSPIYYHFLISIYKKENNKKKALIYLNKLKQEYPYYLKYNKIEL